MKPSRKLARSNAHLRRHCPDRSSLEALADGFEGMEISLYPKTTKMNPKVECGHERKVPRASRPLQLAGGFLPQPAMSMRPATRDSSISASQRRVAHDSVLAVFAATVGLPVKVHQPSLYAIDSVRTAVDRPSHVEQSIISQLSGVAAPPRQESGSDSDSATDYWYSTSEYDHDEGFDGHSTGGEYGSIVTSSAPGGFVSRPVSSSDAREESIYFGEAIFHLNATGKESWL